MKFFTDLLQKPAKLAMSVVGLLVFLILALNSFTIVSPTETKVQICFGKMNESQVFTEGAYLVNPFCSFDSFNTAEQKYEVMGLSIPTQDRFNSTANVTVLFRIIPAKAIAIRKNFGNESTFIETSLRQHLRSIIRDEGRKIKDSRGLASSTNTTAMQENATKRLIDVLTDEGMNVSQVLVQDIEFDSRIAQQILDTQSRIQREEAEKSQTAISISVADQVRNKQKGISDADNTAADATAYAVEAAAKSKAFAVRAAADADRYAAEQLALANVELTKSLTPQILEKQRLENEAILYGKSQGNVPSTVIGSTDLRAYGIPLYSK